MKKYITEFLGTFFLVLAICFSGNPLAIGLTLAVSIYVGGHISGAHYNPAVSIAVFFRGKMPKSDFAPYIVAQMLGAMSATIIYSGFTGKAFLPLPSPAASSDVVFFLELLGTMLLASVVLAVATSSKLAGNHIYGFAIGLTVTAMALSFGPMSGGVFNPAVGLAPWIINFAFSGSLKPEVVSLYGLAPVLGGAIAAFVYRYTNED